MSRSIIVWMIVRIIARVAVRIRTGRVIGRIVLVAVVVALFTCRCNICYNFAQKAADRIQIDVLTIALGTVEEFA